MPKVPDELSSPLFEKLRYKKDLDGYGDKNWTEWFRYLTRDTPLNRTVSELLGDATKDNLAKLWMQNFAVNIQRGLLTDHKLWHLPKLSTPALVIGAGPSVKEKKHLELLQSWIEDDRQRRGLLTVFSTDRMLIPLVHAGITPDYVVTVDGNAEKIARFYQDPLLTGNEEFGLKAILAATVAPNVVQACKARNIPIYWFVAMLDAFTLTNNVTRLMHFMTEATALNCGGNSGSACWDIAWYLEAKTIALIGLDYGYLKGTPIEQTAYFEMLKKSGGETNQILSLYFDHHNPDFNIDCYSDIMFNHYKEAFMQMLELAAMSNRPVETINCTEGGILHGSHIKGMKLQDFLKEVEKITVAPVETN